MIYDIKEAFEQQCQEQSVILKDPPQPWDFVVMEGQKIKEIFMTPSLNKNVDSKPQLRGSF